MPVNIVYTHDSFGPVHLDRIAELSKALGAYGYRILGAPISDDDDVYAWEKLEVDDVFVKPLFPVSYNNTTTVRRFIRLARFVQRHDCKVALHCGYNRIDSVLFATFMRLSGRKIFAILDSKFDDKPRYLWKEFIKYLFLFSYNGIIVSGKRAADYASLFGYGIDKAFHAYNAVSVQRVQAMADDGEPPCSFQDRSFIVVARCIDVKNYDFVLDCYKAYMQLPGAPPRALEIYGDGPEKARIVRRATEENLPNVVFHGWVNATTIARAMRRSLCLLLLSRNETWGNVVNEACAVGLPVICTRNVGATDRLVRNFVNGFVVELENVAGTARAMHAISADESLYQEFVAGAIALQEHADVANYGRAVKCALGLEP